MSLETLRQKYPYLSYALNDPEVGGIMDQADREGWPPEKIQARIMETGWWKNNSQSQRDYHSLANSDPASFWQSVQNKADDITDMAAGLGLDLTAEEIYEAAKAALYFGRSDADIKRALVYGGKSTISDRSGIQRGVKALASQFFLNLSPDTIADWTRKISSGQMTEDNLKAQLSAWAKQLYPHLARVIDEGMTLEQYAAPYKQTIASILELNPANVDMANDPRWKRVLAYDDGSGNVRAMTQTEAEKYARDQPEWGKTKNALDSAAQLGQTLGQSFGKVA